MLIMSSKGQDTENTGVSKQVEVLPATSGDYVVLALNGKMVYENANIFAKELESKIREKGCYIIDVDNLERLDSTGFGVLITLAKKVTSLEGQVGFKVSNEFLKELFDIAKFDSVFPMAATQEAVWQIINGGFQPRISLKLY